MDKFQDAYQKAVQELPALDADKLRRGLPGRIQLRRRVLAARGCTAAIVFLLCGVGTAAAKNYRDSVIKVNDSGFTITSIQEDANSKREPEEGSFFKLGGVFSIVDAVPEEEPDLCEAQIIEMDTCEYNSIEEFLEKGNVACVVPDKTLFGTEFTWENVVVTEEGRGVLIRLTGENCYFFLNQFDNRDVEYYSSSTVYGGKSCNERNFVSRQGLNYVMFDTVDDAGKDRSIHAVISVNGWDLSVTFKGFDEKVVERVLNSLDLTLYFAE